MYQRILDVNRWQETKAPLPHGHATDCPPPCPVFSVVPDGGSCPLGGVPAFPLPACVAQADMYCCGWEGKQLRFTCFVRQVLRSLANWVVPSTKRRTEGALIFLPDFGVRTDLGLCRVQSFTKYVRRKNSETVCFVLFRQTSRGNGIPIACAKQSTSYLVILLVRGDCNDALGGPWCMVT